MRLMSCYRTIGHRRSLARCDGRTLTNGTGKTTISRVIAGEPGHHHCKLAWQGGTPLERMVYNQDFVDRNFNQNGVVA